tara:strand:+ start:11444 stop:14875 length:3432 start_codon:yes stop_codon:yes gene_type:complete
MIDPTDADREAREAFLAEYRRDLEADSLRSLEEYQRQFAGHEAIVADEWRWLEPQSATAASEACSQEAEARHIGPYRIVGELGRGAQATVFLAEHEQLRRRVALKVLRSSPNEFDSTTEQRFRREAEATARLDHPGICSVYESGRSDGLTWIAMQHVVGDTLARCLSRRAESGGASSALPATSEVDSDVTSNTTRGELMRVVAFVEQAARAVHVAHERGLVHRDLKPGNLMVAHDGRPVVLDFGLVHDESESLGLTGSSDVLGTPYYMAPEQLQTTRGAVDRRTDVYSLGVTLFECLTGRRPFDAVSREALFRQILTVEPPSPRTINPDIPRDLEVVVLTALDKDRDRRYQTALEFAEDLRRVRQFEPIAARPVSPAGRLWRWARRHPAIAASVAFAMLSLTVGLTLSLRFQARLESALVTSRAISLAAIARDELENNTTRGLLLAHEAFRLERRFETRSTLHEALAVHRPQTLFDTDGPTFAADMHADGDLIITGTLNGVVQLWARGEARARWTFRRAGGDQPGAEHWVMFAKFVGERRDRIVAGFRDGEVRLWDLDGRELTLPYTTKTRRISYSRNRSLTVPDYPARLMVGLEDGIQVLDVTGDRIERVHEIQQANLLDAIWSSPPLDASWIATARDEVHSNGSLWRLTASGDYELLGPLLKKPAIIRSLAFSKTRLLAALQRGDVVCYDLTADDPLASPQRIKAVGSLVRWLDEARFIAHRVSGKPRVFEFTATGLADPIEFGEDVGAAMTFQVPELSRDGTRAAFAYQDGSMRVFGITTKERIDLIGTFGMSQGMQFTQDGTKLLTWSRSARLWDLNAADELLWRSPNGGLGGKLRVSPDGVHMLSGSNLWNWRTRTKTTFGGLGRPNWSQPRAPFSSDSRFVALRGLRELQVFDIQRDAIVFRHPVQRGGGAYCFLPGTSQVLGFDASTGGSWVVDVETGTAEAGPEAREFVVAAMPSPSGTRVVVTYLPNSAELFERDTTTTPSTWRSIGLANVGNFSRAIAYSPDGELILIGNDNGEILAYDRDLRPTMTDRFSGHRQRIGDLRFSPDGRFAASVSIDGTTRIWHRDGTTYAVLKGNKGHYTCDFTPDGRQLLTAASEVRTWFLDDADLLRAVNERLPRELTPGEREQFSNLLGDR